MILNGTINIKRIYLKLLLLTCYDKNKSQKPTRFGQLLLSLLPKPSVRWDNGTTYQPVYTNRRWLLRSYQGKHEIILERFIKHFVEEGEVVIDVGAQVGLISVLLGKTVGTSGRIFAFEPNPYNFEILHLALVDNHLNNLTCIQRAVGKQDGSAEFAQIIPAGFMRIDGGRAREGVELPVTALDTFARENNIERISMIKIDIDGPDMDVLLGARQLIEREHPLISIEMSKYWADFGYTSHDLFAFLGQFDYAVYSAGRKADKLIRVECESSLPGGAGEANSTALNLYALHWKDHAKQIVELERTFC